MRCAVCGLSLPARREPVSGCHPQRAKLSRALSAAASTQNRAAFWTLYSAAIHLEIKKAAYSGF